jgi:hypothetical protein
MLVVYVHAAADRLQSSRSNLKLLMPDTLMIENSRWRSTRPLVKVGAYGLDWHSELGNLRRWLGRLVLVDHVKKVGCRNMKVDPQSLPIEQLDVKFEMSFAVFE